MYLGCGIISLNLSVTNVPLVPPAIPVALENVRCDEGVRVVVLLNAVPVAKVCPVYGSVMPVEDVKKNEAVLLLTVYVIRS